MSDEPLTNAAVEWMRWSYERLNEVDSLSPSAVTILAEDFSYEDRSRGATNFGRLDGPGWVEVMSTVWDVATGSPRRSAPEVVAVRGARCAAVVSIIDYGNGMYRDSIACLRLDGTMSKLERIVSLDADARTDAAGVVDELHAEIDD